METTWAAIQQGRTHGTFGLGTPVGRGLLVAAALSATLWAYACGDGATEPPAPPPDPPRPTTVAVTPATAQLGALGATVQLSAEVRDQNGQAMAGAAVTWSSGSAAVATVGGSGLVTAAGIGTATITATAGSAAGTATVTVAQEVSAVTVSPAVDTLVAGDTLRLAAEAADANGHAVPEAEFSWASSDTLVAVVDDAGLLTGVGAGEVEVTATAAGVTGRAALAVVAPAPTTVVVTPDTLALTALGQTAQLTAEVRDQAGRLMEGVPVAWSSTQTKVASVGSAGLVTAVGFGATTITATAASAQGTARIAVVSPDRAALVALYETTNGRNWNNKQRWLTDAPLGEWFGVETDVSGRVVLLELPINNLQGPIPSELGSLANLKTLHLGRNNLSGPIPPQLGNLLRLKKLWLFVNDLSGPIPAELGGLNALEELELAENALTGAIPLELGNLTRLRSLLLYRNDLSGPIPPELGDLTQLRTLLLDDNDLSGPIPPELGNLAGLVDLWLHDNNLSGPIPPQLGNLSSLWQLWLRGNSLSGPIPSELGDLSALSILILDNNDFAGSVPQDLGGMASLSQLSFANNPEMSGALPARLTNLRNLQILVASGTNLCAPQDAGFQSWLQGVHSRRIAPCGSGDPPTAYLTQAVQSREFPVPLVAGEKALLRVFPTARQSTSEGIPLVRARFYLNGRETHVEDIPGKSAPIPTDVDEGSLLKSANAEVPRGVIRPGLEMVIEIDPDGTLDPGLGVAKRIPETGRMTIQVREMPLFDLTVIPFLWSADPDITVVEAAEGMAADPETHELLRETRTLLPVGDIRVTAHEPVLSSSNNAFTLRDEAKAIRALEGGSGHYMGMMSGSVSAAAGVAYFRGRASFSVPVAGIIAHELGHNMSLFHAPCGATFFLDPSFPYPDGSAGVWGYDFRGDGGLVHPSTPDLMSYCGPPDGISDYHFTNALRYRLHDEGSAAAAEVAAPTTSLLLWGGVNADSEPFLEPVFVVAAPPALPDSTGEHRLIGENANGVQLFSLSFAMPQTTDGDGSSSFAFVLPVQPGWEDDLDIMTLTGPGGSVIVDRDTNFPMAILRNPRNGQVRGIVRDPPSPTRAATDAVGRRVGTGLEVLFSRGIPDAEAWRR